MAIANEGYGGKYTVGKKKATLPKSMTKVGSGKKGNTKITTKPKKKTAPNPKNNNTTAKNQIKAKKEPVADNTRGIGRKVATPPALTKKGTAKPKSAPKKVTTTVKKTAPKKSTSSSSKSKSTSTKIVKATTPKKTTTTVTKKPVTKAPVTKAPAPKPTPKPVPKPTPKPPATTKPPVATTPPVTGGNYDQQIKDLMDKINFMQQNMLPSQNINAYDKAKYLFTPSGGDQNVIHEYQGQPGQVGGQPGNTPQIPDALRQQMLLAKQRGFGRPDAPPSQYAQLKHAMDRQTLQRYMQGHAGDLNIPQGMQDQMANMNERLLQGGINRPAVMPRPQFPGGAQRQPFNPQIIDAMRRFRPQPIQPKPLPVQPQPVNPNPPVTTLPYQPL